MPQHLFAVFLALKALSGLDSGVVSHRTAAVPALETQAPSTRSNSDYEAGLEALGNGDLSAAHQRFRAAAEAGHVQAAGVLGLALVQGTVGVIDVEEGVRWLAFSAERGNADAQFNFGVALYSGVGGERNLEQAFRWFKTAAEAGHPEAAYNLGTFYDDGIVVQKDEATAAEWYRKAAEGDVTEAMHTLGMMLVAGRGVPRNLHVGAELLARAKEEGDHDVDEDIKELLRTLPPNERAELEAALRR
jgi:TPR repeat protein